MSDLRNLSPAALKAAMEGGTATWGQWASSEKHVRYMEPLEPEYRLRKCRCGCLRRETHRGMANGMALMEGCELEVRRWVRDGR